MPLTLGLYLGTDNIDITSLAGTFQHPKLITFARTKLPVESQWRSQLRVEGEAAGPAAPGTSDGLQSIARVLQTILPKLGAASPNAFVAIPSEAVVIRYFQMPTIPSHERKMAISFEAKKYLPFKLEDLICDYEVVIRRTDPTVMRVMFFGVKRSSVETYLSLFRSTGVNPLCLEPAPLSLIRLARHTGQLDNGPVAAILYVEHDSATISIARNDVLYLSRNVSIAPTAEDYGEDPPPDLLDALVNETRVSIDYYRRRFLGEPAVSKILFFGKSADPKKIADLSAALDLPVETSDPFTKIAGAQAVPPGLAVVAGLALRALDRKPKEINLLPAELRRKNLPMAKPLALEAAAAALLLAVWYGGSLADLSGMEKRMTALRNQAPAPAEIPRDASLDLLRQIKGTQEQELQVLKNLQDPSLKTSEMLSLLSREMPKETWLLSLLYRNAYKVGDPNRRRFLRLEGNAYAGNRDLELERINQLLATLRRHSLFSGAFKEFSLDSVQRTHFEEEEVAEFALSCATHSEDIRREAGAGPRSRIRP